MATQNLEYPHPLDPNVDYGEPGRIDCTCAECEQVWLKEDFDNNGLCPECRPVEELDEEDKEWWDMMTRGCEKYHEQKENSI